MNRALSRRAVAAGLLLAPALPASAAAHSRVRVGPGHHPTVAAGLAALPPQGGELLIAPGAYREKLTIEAGGVTLTGLGAKPGDVVLVFGDGARTAGGTFKSSTLNVSGDDFTARNLTIQNDYHLRDPQRSQAVALSITGDRAVFDKVVLLGAQDTLYAASRKGRPPSRQYFHDCRIEGHVDFIFGDAKAFFDRCHIHAITNDEILITAQSKNAPDQDSAYVFDRCVITAEPGAGNVYLGRAWRPYAAVIFMRTDIRAPLNPAGWREWHPGRTTTLDTAYFAEFASTGPGGDVSAREPRTHQLTRAQAARWSKSVFLAGADGWRPKV
ncbi:pectinesterase family protein [Caulobacter segnis]|uniref:pectinesterase family protein n=1 Tax=Caulobacter segnis TaxID=88688 RepID=UPI00240F1DFA|nr:pectinesterase family protein [Caulobacter segnis]MDG2520343.1 pectinesterase family protein [Caulobacter segnis]